MKRTVLALILCLLPALSACGQLSNKELMDTIPSMTVTDGNQHTSASASGGTWKYKSQGVAVDGLHPLQALDTLSAESAITASAGTELHMNFSVLPDNVTVTYWSADETIGDTIPEGRTIEVTFANDLFSFTLPENNAAVSATAQWTGYSDISGTFSYSFLVK